MKNTLLVASEAESVVTITPMNLQERKSQSLPTLRGLESTAKIAAPSSRRGSFSLDSPFHRTAYPVKCRKFCVQGALHFFTGDFRGVSGGVSMGVWLGIPST